MENIVLNELSIFTDNYEQLSAFIDTVDDRSKGSVLCLENLIPYPVESADENNDESKCLVCWCIENWGTPGVEGADVVEVVADRAAFYIFESYVLPPTTWIKNIAPGYPDLEFILEYKDSGSRYLGIITAKGGTVRDQVIHY